MIFVNVHVILVSINWIVFLRLKGVLIASVTTRRFVVSVSAAACSTSIWLGTSRYWRLVSIPLAEVHHFPTITGTCRGRAGKLRYLPST